MTGRKSIKSGYGEVTPGTKRARVLEALKASRGLTLHEAGTICIGCLSSEIAALEDSYGYDIRCFPKARKRGSPTGRDAHVYRCVGRWEWDGHYHDYTLPSVAAR